MVHIDDPVDRALFSILFTAGVVGTTVWAVVGIMLLV
jgi:hypothetical protein